MERSLGGSVRILAMMAGYLVVLISAIGCTHGKGFYQEIDELKLGATPESTCTALFGEPIARSSMSANGESYEWRVYSLTASGSDYRGLNVELRKGIVNGYNYFSTADEDRTHANISAVSEIKTGVTTRDQVLQLLGQPTGRIRIPSGYRELAEFSQRPDASDAWTWFEITDSSYWRPRPRRMKLAYVVFDTSGKVIKTFSLDRPLPFAPQPVQTQTYYVPQYQYHAPPAHHHK